jgi:hypothetical protein
MGTIDARDGDAAIREFASACTPALFRSAWLLTVKGTLPDYCTN